ncbi:MAG: hypothetical protein J6T08_08445 [Lentisphaeria bacterium]|nr:hypothetical protein [Lentisphaeria bacterium]
MSEINTNNLIDVDDTSIKENTPMMLIEQGGKTIAVPIPAYISGGGTSDETAVRDKYYECVSISADGKTWTGVEYSQLVAPYGIAITSNGATDLYLEKEVNGNREYGVSSIDGASTGKEISFGGECWVLRTGYDYVVYLDITNEDATTEEIAEAVNRAEDPTGLTLTAEAVFYAVWVKDSENKTLDKLSNKSLTVGSVYRGDGLLEVKEFRASGSLTSDALKRIHYEYREELMTPVEDVLIVAYAGNASGVYRYESNRHWTMTAADGTKYGITAGIGDCMIADITNSKQLYYSVYKPDYSYPETAKELVEAIDGEWWNPETTKSTDIGLAVKTMVHLGDGKVVELVSDFNGDI